MIRDHWTKYLPDAGTITRSGDSQELIYLKIERLRQELARIEQEYQDEERSIEKYILGLSDGWSREEIATAQELAKKYTIYREYISDRLSNGSR